MRMVKGRVKKLYPSLFSIMVLCLLREESISVLFLSWWNWWRVCSSTSLYLLLERKKICLLRTGYFQKASFVFLTYKKSIKIVKSQIWNVPVHLEKAGWHLFTQLWPWFPYLWVPTKSSQTRWSHVIYAVSLFETLSSSKCIPHPRREQCTAANVSLVTTALVIVPSVVPCAGLRWGAAEFAPCSLLTPGFVFPALRDSGQPLCSQWALHRHLRLCPGPDGAAGDEVLCKRHWVCSQQDSTQLAPAFWGFFGGRELFRKQLSVLSGQKGFYSSVLNCGLNLPGIMASLAWSQCTFLESQSSMWISTAVRKLDGG